ncbi:hypothetical protein A1Q2_05552 [Trichosporon asahii var. asahii CBS 8904]|uniref:Uncharacterized protein n=1 Tax=Trichosporon asahii var. asahii (strain CBS 8904) TaxID=1220162 RepID=K1WF86_TRIAC|nr:hypothetical protein A1Q2_05552 [Trichosporon asahii var. asahii CBS 8904]
MLFVPLVTSALALLGPAAGAPLDANAVAQAEPRSDETSVNTGMALLPRKESPTLQAFLDRISDDPLDNDEAYVTKVMEACQDRWRNHNIFIFHRSRGFTWAVEDPDRALEATATHNYLFNEERFGVVVFKTAGWLQKSGDGGYGNWRVSGNFNRDDDSLFTFGPVK